MKTIRNYKKHGKVHEKHRKSTQTQQNNRITNKILQIALKIRKTWKNNERIFKILKTEQNNQIMHKILQI